MNYGENHKPFIFNERIDREFLYNLYENDYSYMEEIFLTTISQLLADFPTLEITYNSGDIHALEKVVHKIKPSFGFVGMPLLQERCQQFENQCKASTIEDISKSFAALQETIKASVEIIEQEYERLKSFNRRA
jgi:HPt (histidine-containing phosphotransfer) domain-containing protein